MRKGSKHTKITKKKIGAKSKLRRHSPTTRFKMSKSHKGLNTWSKGCRKSIETRRKMGLSRIGPKNPAWRGGISSINDKLRSCIELRLWREAVYKRDGYTCQKSNQVGYKLNAHHIYNFMEYPELRFAIDNGITFCEEQHKEFHRRYGIKHNTPEQVLEFLEN